jgi:short-subunit dehydrogenase
MSIIGIVTGASSGLGREFVQRIADGWKCDEIWVIARRKERLEELAGQCSTKIRVFAYDITNIDSIREIQKILEEEKPAVKVLVQAAGSGKIGSYKDLSLEEENVMIDLNCRAAVDITKIVIPYMKPGSRIIEICSTAAFQPLQYLSVYAASKSFLYRYSRALRVELAPKGIVVTAVCPYWIKDTEFIAKAKQSKNSSYIKSFPFASMQTSVVRGALRDSRMGLAVSTPGLICTFDRLVGKIIPADAMMGAWELIRHI